MHSFWRAKKIDDAMKLAMATRAAFQEAGEMAFAEKFGEAGEAVKKAAAACAGCHSAHREKAEDGSWKIKY